MCPKLTCWCSTPQLEFVRKRYHKDILNSPVLMLNFCPDLFREPLELHKATRELLFLVDRSGSMSGTNISRVKVGWIKATTEQEFLDFGACIKKTPSCLLLFVFFHRKPWWWPWRVSLPAPCSTSSASAPPSSLCSPPASSALMLASHSYPAQKKKNLALFIRFPAKQITLFSITYVKQKHIGSCFPESRCFQPRWTICPALYLIRR